MASELVVFAQRADATVDVEAFAAYAERFVATRIGLAEERPRPPAAGAPARFDAARFVVAPDDASPGIRAVRARPRTDEDLAAAEAADARAGVTGLALLARRCPTVWLVEREAESDALSWRLAIVFAGVLLGPILDTDAGTLVGVATARSRLNV